MPSAKQSWSDQKASPNKPLSHPSPGLDHPFTQAHLASTVQRAALTPHALTPQDIIQLQRTIGNQAVGRLLASPAQGRAVLPVTPTTSSYIQLQRGLQEGQWVMVTDFGERVGRITEVMEMDELCTYWVWFPDGSDPEPGVAMEEHVRALTEEEIEQHNISQWNENTIEERRDQQKNRDFYKRMQFMMSKQKQMEEQKTQELVQHNGPDGKLQMLKKGEKSFTTGTMSECISIVVLGNPCLGYHGGGGFGSIPAGRILAGGTGNGVIFCCGYVQAKAPNDLGKIKYWCMKHDILDKSTLYVSNIADYTIYRTGRVTQTDNETDAEPLSWDRIRITQEDRDDVDGRKYFEPPSKDDSTDNSE